MVSSNKPELTPEEKRLKEVDGYSSMLHCIGVMIPPMTCDLERPPPPPSLSSHTHS